MQDFIIDLLNKYKKIVNWIVLVLIILGALSLYRRVLKTKTINDEIKEKEDKLAEIKRSNDELRNRLQEVESKVYIEKQLRDNLGLVKDGEIVVVLPEPDTVKKLSPKVDDEETQPIDPNWKKWMELFGFGV